MAFTTWSDGDVLTASALNANFLPTKIAEIYTGTAIDVDRSGTVGTTTNNTTLVLTSSELDNATYLILSLSYLAYATGGATTNSAQVTLKIERKDTGGAFTDLLSTTSVRISTQSAGTDSSTGLQTIVFPITLTSAEKSAGVELKFTTAAILGDNFGQATFTNHGIILQTSY